MGKSPYDFFYSIAIVTFENDKPLFIIIIFVRS